MYQPDGRPRSHREPDTGLAGLRRTRDRVGNIAAIIAITCAVVLLAVGTVHLLFWMIG